MRTRSTRYVLMLGPAIAAVLAAGATAATAGEAHLYLAPYVFPSHFSGDGRISGGNGGTDFDTQNTLGIDPEETVTGLDGFVKFLGNRIEFSYSGAKYSGDTALDSDFQFNGTTFLAGERVATDLDYKRYKLMYGYDFNLKIVNVGFLLGGHLVDADARIASRTSGVKDEESVHVPIPAIGVTVGVHPISKLAVHAELSGFSISISNVDAKMLDGYAAVDFYFLPRFGVTGGYRYFKLEATDKDKNDHLDLTQRGPYLGLVLHL